MAIRTFKQIAEDYRKEFLSGAWSLENEFFVDDLLAGGESLAEVICKKKELIIILEKAGIKLKKMGV